MQRIENCLEDAGIKLTPAACRWNNPEPPVKARPAGR